MSIKSGVYIITNVKNGKIYVGSSITISRRWHDHKKLLRANKHRNRHLQNAWNKDGEISFLFNIVEVCDTDNLMEREQWWLDQTLCTNDCVGYNISPSAENNRGAKRTDEYKQRRSQLSQKVWEGFINPQGNGVIITNLKKFCLENNLNVACMMSLSYGRGRLRKHRGWTHINSNKSTRRKTSATFVDCSGIEMYVDNVSKWISENGYDRATVYRVIKGDRKSFNGWRIKNA